MNGSINTNQGVFWQSLKMLVPQGLAPGMIGDADPADVAGREAVVPRMVVVHGQAELLHVVDALDARRAASRAACTAGSSRAIKTAMIAITTSSSISVNPRTLGVLRHGSTTPHWLGIRTIANERVDRTNTPSQRRGMIGQTGHRTTMPARQHPKWVPVPYRRTCEPPPQPRRFIKFRRNRSSERGLRTTLELDSEPGVRIEGNIVVDSAGPRIQSTPPVRRFTQSVRAGAADFPPFTEPNWNPVMAPTPSTRWMRRAPPGRRVVKAAIKNHDDGDHDQNLDQRVGTTRRSMLAPHQTGGA